MNGSIELRKSNKEIYILWISPQFSHPSRKSLEVVSVANCTPELLQDFHADLLVRTHAWFDTPSHVEASGIVFEEDDDQVSHGIPSDYGDLLATRQANNDLVINDEAGYAELFTSFGIQS